MISRLKPPSELSSKLSSKLSSYGIAARVGR